MRVNQPENRDPILAYKEGIYWNCKLVFDKMCNLHKRKVEGFALFVVVVYDFNKTILLTPLTIRTLPTLGDRAFTATAARLWNSLLIEFREEQSLDNFKKELKTHLCRIAYLVISILHFTTFINFS